MTRRIRIDPTLCDGAGFCADMFPERIDLDDWGYPMISGEPVDDPRLKRLAARAVRICPRHALFVATSDGTDPPASDDPVPT